MAKENSIILIGKIIDNPTIAYSEKYQSYKISWKMEVLRRNQRTDYPRIKIYDLNKLDAEKIIADLKSNKNAYAMVRGMISTKMNQKVIKCPSCEKEKSVLVLETDVIAFAPPVILVGNYDSENLKELSNNASIIGIVCSDPFKRNCSSGTSLTQFQIVIHRKFHVKEHPEIKDDYPWVKTFSNLADESAAHLKVGSQIYINGALQTRESQRNTVCDECKSKITYSENVAEIVPYDIEYLNNCIFERKLNAKKIKRNKKFSYLFSKISDFVKSLKANKV